MEARSSRPLAAAAWAGILQGAASLTACEAALPPPAVVEIGPALPAPPATSEPDPPRPVRVARPAPARACGNACAGKNECKGKGGCKTDKNACKGMNTCKGRGGCRTGDCP
jgi:hypothetical protein